MSRPGYQRRSQPKKRKIGEIIGTFFIFVILIPIGVLAAALGVVSFSAWGIMLVLGIVHAHILPAVQPAGYVDTWPLALVFFIFGFTIGAVLSVLPSGKD